MVTIEGICVDKVNIDISKLKVGDLKAFASINKIYKNTKYMENLLDLDRSEKS